MKRIIRNTVLSVLLLTSLCMHAQDPCLKELRAIYKKMAALEKNNNGPSVYYLDYSVKTATIDSADGATEESVKMWMGQGKLQIKSPHLEVYQDKEDVFMVLPQRKLLIRSDVSAKNEKKLDKRRNYLEFLQDSIFSVCRVTGCESIQGKGGADKKITLRLNAGGEKFFGISRLTFYINSSKGEIKKVRMDYYQGSGEEYVAPRGILYIEYSFNELSFNCRDKSLSNNVSSLFLHGEKLSSSYSGYKLIDNRNKKGILK